MLQRGITPEQLAAEISVDPKSVERWIAGRTPYRRHRYKVATYLGVDEVFLWPDALSPHQIANASESEIISVYPHRWTVPSDMWRNFFEGAEREIGILVYSGMFLAEDAGVVNTLRRKAMAGATVRILLGDPDSEEVAQRGADEEIGDNMAARIRNVIVLLRSLRNIENVEFRAHRTILYNSIYRADDQLMINTHIYGFPAAQAPVLHLRKVAGGDMVTSYLESFDSVWDKASPLE
ncbi:helix-turn-helix domain-containing protein [Rhizocola hellebori]|uniref:helix-turn-helix domain-containing protein n=1 Tax=Rhizocola hellebori TaxID=1392758 RepID=UPI001EF243FA|nr:helix-turn-helix transcriptional regulator [Rhizocola hellebori]